MPKKSDPKNIIAIVPQPTSPEPAQVRAELHQQILNAAPLIVSKNIEKAQEGSYLHAKFLFEFAGLQAVLPDHAADEEESLAEILLRELESGAPHPAPAPA